MGFSRQEYWSGLPFPSPGDLPNPGIEPRSPALQADALTSEPPGKTKMGTIKDRNGMDLTEAEYIKKMWKEYTEELYKKDLHNSDNHDGVITHLEPDILECEVKWTLDSITMNEASGGDGIPVELFQILKDDAALNMPANLENSAVATGLEKVSFHSNPKESQCQRMLKLLHNCTHLTH